MEMKDCCYVCRKEVSAFIDGDYDSLFKCMTRAEFKKALAVWQENHKSSQDDSANNNNQSYHKAKKHKKHKRK